jgi:Na+/melibiose symporter-like transporter
MSTPTAARTAAGSPHRAQRARWFAAAAAMFCCAWGGNQFTPLLLLYRHLGGYSEVTVDAFLGAYVLGLVPGLLIGGPLSDRHGRKPVLWWGTLLSAVSSAVLCGPGEAWIYAGRFATGAAVGVAMAVGSSWLKELADRSGARSGARRASLSLTAGFALGAGAAGVLAQWAPWPMVTPYVLHVLVTLPVLFALTSVGETRVAGREGSLWSDLKVPAAGHRRFCWVVLPMAPWIFGAAGLAYVVTPQLVSAQVGQWGLLYATLLTVATLGTGFAVQPLAKRLDSTRTARAILTAMLVVVVGVLLAAANAVVLQPVLGLLAAVILGAGYGVALVSGLQEVQRIADPEDLAGLTGVYYAVAYSGFLLPTVLAALAPVVPYPVTLLVLAGIAAGCLALVASRSGHHLPISR